MVFSNSISRTSRIFVLAGAIFLFFPVGTRASSVVGTLEETQCYGNFPTYLYFAVCRDFVCNEGFAINYQFKNEYKSGVKCEQVPVYMDVPLQLIQSKLKTASQFGGNGTYSIPTWGNTPEKLSDDTTGEALEAYRLKAKEDWLIEKLSLAFWVIVAFIITVASLSWPWLLVNFRPSYRDRFPQLILIATILQLVALYALSFMNNLVYWRWNVLLPVFSILIGSFLFAEYLLIIYKMIVFSFKARKK